MLKKEFEPQNFTKVHKNRPQGGRRIINGGTSAASTPGINFAQSAHAPIRRTGLLWIFVDFVVEKKTTNLYGYNVNYEL